MRDSLGQEEHASSAEAGGHESLARVLSSTLLQALARLLQEPFRRIPDLHKESLWYAFFLTVNVVLPAVLLCSVFVYTVWWNRGSGSNNAERGRPAAEPATAGNAFEGKPIEVQCPDGVTRHLAWWHRSRVGSFVHVLSRPEHVDPVEPPWSLEALTNVFEEFGIPIVDWTREARVYLLDELATGRSRLCSREERPVRIVELVLVVLEHPQERHVLQETVSMEAKGEARFFDPLPERTMSTRRLPGEQVVAAAQRCLMSKLKTSMGTVMLHDTPLQVMDVTEQVTGFPGLTSIVRKFVVHAEVVCSDANKLEAIGLCTSGWHSSLKLGKREYMWVPVDSTITLRHLLCRQSSSSPASSRMSLQFIFGVSSGPVQQALMEEVRPSVILPWSEDTVSAVLQERGVHRPEEHLGRPLPELVRQLQGGHCSLGIRRSDGLPVCTQDVITVLLASRGGQVLVEPQASGLAEEGIDAPGLPCGVLLAGEDAWTAVRRIARAQLGILPRDLCIQDQIVQQVLPSGSALICEDKHPTTLRPAGWLLREFVVLCHPPQGYHVLDTVPSPDI